MSYEEISKAEPVARKEYACIWCHERIEKGEKHIHEVSKYDGDFQDMRWHMECLKAFHDSYDKNDGGEFEPHSHNRGTNDEWTGTRTIGASIYPNVF